MSPGAGRGRTASPSRPRRSRPDSWNPGHRLEGERTDFLSKPPRLCLGHGQKPHREGTRCGWCCPQAASGLFAQWLSHLPRPVPDGSSIAGGKQCPKVGSLRPEVSVTGSCRSEHGAQMALPNPLPASTLITATQLSAKTVPFPPWAPPSLGLGCWSSDEQWPQLCLKTLFWNLLRP